MTSKYNNEIESISRERASEVDRLTSQSSTLIKSFEKTSNELSACDEAFDRIIEILDEHKPIPTKSNYGIGTYDTTQVLHRADEMIKKQTGLSSSKKGLSQTEQNTLNPTMVKTFVDYDEYLEIIEQVTSSIPPIRIKL